ncbi:hypothetical protein [Candidatus Poriferisodalis sp.]|uniref:hypothetical protein n=1 Tax=Candidatus Poriferisodalis sp. TaxID=3101277 RepID=UPI003B5251D1
MPAPWRLGVLIVALPFTACTTATPETATVTVPATTTTVAVVPQSTTAPVIVLDAEPSAVDVVLTQAEDDPEQANEALCKLRGELRSTYAALYDEWTAQLEFAETNARVEHIAEHAAEALVLWQSALPPPECEWCHGRFYEDIWAAYVDHAERWAEYSPMLYGE